MDKNQNLYTPNYQGIRDERSHAANKEEGYMIDIGVTRAGVIGDMAIMYELTGKSEFMPNGHFTDAEFALFDVMSRIFRAGKRIGEGKEA